MLRVSKSFIFEKCNNWLSQTAMAGLHSCKKKNPKKIADKLPVMPNPFLSFLRYLCCLFSRREEFLLFPCVCTFECFLLWVSRLPQWEESHSHTLYLPQENRQFGSKMTDSKYFTTTKKGILAPYYHYFSLIVKITHQWGLLVNIFYFRIFWYGFYILQELFYK